MSTDTFREDKARESVRRAIASTEARLSEEFSMVSADCLRSHVERLTELARTPEQFDEALAAVTRFNENAEHFGIEEIV